MHKNGLKIYLFLYQEIFKTPWLFRLDMVYYNYSKGKVESLSERRKFMRVTNIMKKLAKNIENYIEQYVIDWKAGENKWN